MEVEYVSVDDLLLDPENPRLGAMGDAATQDNLVRMLWQEMAVDEVALSIAANGYFKEEPLFVVPVVESGKRSAKREYIVVEGNRRLAAVKILRDERLRTLVKATSLPKITSLQRRRLDTLPVSKYDSKKDLWQYFGFRHVNGPKAWDSLSKAAYIADVVRNYGISLNDIAKTIGDRHDFVVRIYRGYLLLEQAESDAHFAREDRMEKKLNFSHLYTAATYKEFQEFLGIPGARKTWPKKPVPKTHVRQLRELMVWIFGSKAEGKLPVVEAQYPGLNDLRRVLGNRQALVALRAGLGLKRAHEISRGDTSRFAEALARSKNALEEAKSTVTTGYEGDSENLKTMDDVLAIAQGIRQEMIEMTKRRDK